MKLPMDAFVSKLPSSCPGLPTVMSERNHTNALLAREAYSRERKYRTALVIRLNTKQLKKAGGRKSLGHQNP